MRKRSCLQAISVSLLTALLLAACSLFGTSKEERVMRFEKDLKDSRENLYQNFLESATTSYTTLKTQEVIYTWNTWFPPAEPFGSFDYTIDITNTTADTVEGTITGPSQFGFPNPQAIIFHLVRSGIDWYLEGITLNGSKIVD